MGTSMLTRILPSSLIVLISLLFSSCAFPNSLFDFTVGDNTFNANTGNLNFNIAPHHVFFSG